MTIITKSQFAAELGVTKARVSQYVGRGLPVRADGKLDRDAALKWMAQNCVVQQRSSEKGVARARKLVSPETALDHREFDAGAVWAAQRLVYQMGASAAIMAVSCGAPMRVAFALKKALTLAAMVAASELLAANKVGPFAVGEDAEVWNLDGVFGVDWEWLAAEAGEPVDMAAWEAFAATLPIYQADEAA